MAVAISVSFKSWCVHRSFLDDLFYRYILIWIFINI